MKKIQLVLNILSVIIVCVPIAIICISEYIFSAVASKTILTVALLLLEMSIIMGIVNDKKEQKISYSKIGYAIAILWIAVWGWIDM